MKPETHKSLVPFTNARPLVPGKGGGLQGGMQAMTKERIIECFEVIAHGRLQISGNGEAGAVDLVAAQIVVEPRIHGLRQDVAAILKQHGVRDPRIESLSAAEGVTAYIVGVLYGLDLAGRPEIVSRFAELYKLEAKRSVDSLFTTVAPTVLASVRGGPAPKRECKL